MRLSIATLACGLLITSGLAMAAESSADVKFTVEPGHEWTPPFGLERVGRPLDAVVDVPAGVKPTDQYTVVSYRDGREIGRQVVTFPKIRRAKPEYRFGRVTLSDWPTEAALLLKTDSTSEAKEIARAKATPPAFEAEAVARTDKTVNPIDLGTVFVPHDWLLLTGGQAVEVDVAALSRIRDLSDASVVSWYESNPDQRSSASLNLAANAKQQAKVSVGHASKTLDRDTLHVAITDGQGKEIWHKKIPVMLVQKKPEWPAFGAVTTKLRYDPPIPVNGGRPIDYAKGWDPKFQDVVAFFPNGARFVIWRGSSYCPFWAGQGNTGLCHEWAELWGPHIKNPNDAVEPLQDKELRYGRAEIIESTPARIHLRWSYRSCDLDYKIWGDTATEDYYFYPDSFGTRMLTLVTHPNTNAETSEFIIFTPQGGYPFDILPKNIVDVIWPQGKAEFQFPLLRSEQAEQWAKLDSAPKDAPLIHRIHIGKNDPLAVVQYSARGSSHDLPGFPGFYDRGAQVTPMYWGSHWPLSRGFPTLFSINDRIHQSPGHNSAYHSLSPKPLRSEPVEIVTPDGTTKTFERITYDWLIGMTDASDDRLRQWAQSVTYPAVVTVEGDRAGKVAFVPERRAFALTVGSEAVTLNIAPVGCTVNPVFEITGASQKLESVVLNGQELPAEKYRWDGRVLWLDATLTKPTTLKLQFTATK